MSYGVVLCALIFLQYIPLPIYKILILQCAIELTVIQLNNKPQNKLNDFTSYFATVMKVECWSACPQIGILSTTTMTDGDHDGFTTQLTATKAHSVEMLITNAQLNIIMIGTSTINSMICILGMVTNSLNIIIFYKLDLALTTNYSFFVLAITDLLYMLHGFIHRIIWFPLVNDVLFNFSWYSLMYLIAPIYVGYSAFGSWVQTVIALERACCIAFPLKVTQKFETLNRR